MNRCAGRGVTGIGSFDPFSSNGSDAKRDNRPERFNQCMIKKRLLTTGELADALGVISANTLTRYVREGKLEPTEITPGGHFRWDLEDARKKLRALRE